MPLFKPQGPYEDGSVDAIVVYPNQKKSVPECHQKTLVVGRMLEEYECTQGTKSGHQCYTDKETKNKPRISWLELVLIVAFFAGLLYLIFTTGSLWSDPSSYPGEFGY